MENNINSIQDLIDLVNILSKKNRKENGVYNITLANLCGLLATELNRVNEFIEQQGIQTFKDWELLSKKSVQSELENIHVSINLNNLNNN